MKTKLKYYNDKNITNFFSKRVTEGNVNCLCIDVIVLDSVCKIKRTIIHKYPEKSVNTKKRKEIVSFISEDLQSSDDGDDGDDDDDDNVDKDSDEEDFEQKKLEKI